MSDLEELRKVIVKFTQERDWDQFHNGKDLALALSIEASELNEAFLWKDSKDVNVEKVKEELADIFNYAILIADKYDLDIKQIVLDKLRRNAEKYPVARRVRSSFIRCNTPRPAKASSVRPSACSIKLFTVVTLPPKLY